MGKLKSVGEASRPEIQVGVDATVLRQKLFFSTKSQVCALRPSAYREDQPDKGGSSPLQKSADSAMFPLPPRALEQHLDLCLLRCLGLVALKVGTSNSPSRRWDISKHNVNRTTHGDFKIKL